MNVRAGNHGSMTKTQLTLLSFLPAIASAGLLTAIFFAATGGVAGGSGMMWGLLAVTLILGLFGGLAMPAAVFFLIPAGKGTSEKAGPAAAAVAGGAAAVADEEDSAAAVDDEEFDVVEVEDVAEMDDFDDDEDFQAADGLEEFDEEFVDDFDDSEDFV